MDIPDRITARWIDSLTNDEIQDAERRLKDTFQAEESAEKRRRGGAYSLMKSPEALTLAWIRWSMVCNATRARRLKTSYR